MKRQFGHFLGMKEFIPSEGRRSPCLIMLTFKGQTLDPGLKDFSCPTSTQMLRLKLFGAVSVLPKGLVTQTFFWARGQNVADTGSVI